MTEIYIINYVDYAAECTSCRGSFRTKKQALDFMKTDILQDPHDKNHDFYCNSCEIEIKKGYRCTICYDFNFCTNCYNEKKHKHTYEMYYQYQDYDNPENLEKNGCWYMNDGYYKIEKVLYYDTYVKEWEYICETGIN